MLLYFEPSHQAGVTVKGEPWFMSFEASKIKCNARIMDVNKCSCETVSAERLSNFTISVGNVFDDQKFDATTYEECWFQSAALGPGETRDFICRRVILGRYVAIHFPPDKTEPLTLCEVEVHSDLGNFFRKLIIFNFNFFPS